MNKISISFLCAGLMFFASCSDEYNICGTSKTVRFKGSFYQVNGGIDVAAPVASLAVYNADGTAIFTNPSSTTSFAWSLNPVVDSASYIIGIAALQPDTMTVIYTSQNVMISADCGNVDQYLLSKVYSTAHTIDSVKVIDPAVDITAAQNIKIYY